MTPLMIDGIPSLVVGKMSREDEDTMFMESVKWREKKGQPGSN